MIQSPTESTSVAECTYIHTDVNLPKTGRRSIEKRHEPSLGTSRINASDRKTSRSLADISSLGALATPFSTDDRILFAWQLARMAPTKLLHVDVNFAIEKSLLPGFGEFFATVEQEIARQNPIGYLPLIPSSPTNPALVEAAMTQLVKLAQKVGMQHTVITCDLAIYEIARALRQKCETFSNVILVLGGFHLCHNFMKVITKIMKGSGAEEILVSANIALTGTSPKIFSDRCHYYQSMQALTLLYEVMNIHQWGACEDWCLNEENNLEFLPQLNSLVDDIHTMGAFPTYITPESQTVRSVNDTLQDSEACIHKAQSLLSEFQATRADIPTHVVWQTFIEMMGILLRCLHAQRSGIWTKYLAEAANMLPFVIAAGHHKYGVQLPLHLHEMKELEAPAPDVHNRFLEHGEFTVRRANGKHNGVSPDMILEQTYNADVKQRQGLTGITLNQNARTKWLYSKPVVASMSGTFRDMLGVSTDETFPRCSTGLTRAKRDVVLIQKAQDVITSQMINPFIDKGSQLVDIATGQQTSETVCHDMTHIREIGQNALTLCLETGGEKLRVVHLKTFSSEIGKKGKSKMMHVSSQAGEVNVLHRLSQVIASGGTVDIADMIGHYECVPIPPSLFDDAGLLRRGSKANLVPVLLDDTTIAKQSELPKYGKKTTVVVDAMHAIQRWSFLPGESFDGVQSRYLRNIVLDSPESTDAIHFVCDRYDKVPSLKSVERTRRNNGKATKVYSVAASLPTPAFRDFIATSENKSAFLCFLSESWSSIPAPYLSRILHIFIGGGFDDPEKAVMVSKDETVAVPQLQCNHEEADTRIILHCLYSVTNMDAERIVVHTNDTDVFVLCIYYCSKYPQLNDLWIRTDDKKYIPVHELTSQLGSRESAFLPFFHALTGKDDTSFVYGLGKRKLWKSHKTVDNSLLEEFGEPSTDQDGGSD